MINAFKETNNIKANLDRFFKKTVDGIKMQQGISLFGVDGQKYKVLLTGERHTLVHMNERRKEDI